MTAQNSLLKTVNLLSEIVVYDSLNFAEFLKKLIRLILKLVPADSCLIYFYDKSNRELTLVASKKPHAKLIGNIKLKKGEGITGWFSEHKKSVVIPNKAYKDPRFKHFDELPEDEYESFLSVPILNKDGIVGVVNLQNKKVINFTKTQIETLEAIVKVVASAFRAILLTKQISSLETQLEDSTITDRAKGVLMEKDSLTEKQAYELIRKEAMKKRKTKREIADAVLLVWG